MIYDTLVIGGGQAGLATGYYLQQAGLRFLILDARAEPGGSWSHYYDSLTLNSPARYSSLPGLPFSGQPDRYPARDEVVAYLREYAAYLGLPIVGGVQVRRVERVGQLFQVLTNDGDCYLARTVVAATGFFGHPYRPSLAGQERFGGQVLHTADYRRPEPFRGQRIVIVGGANGAVRIGVELATVAHVTLATRAPIRYLPQQVLGQDIHFWLRSIGLDRVQWQGNQSTPVFASQTDLAALSAGRPDRRPMFARFSEQGVVWADGTQEKVDTVVFGTGYRPDLAYLAGLGAMDEQGRVLQQQGRSTSVPGLYYCGLPRQRSAASATLRGVGPDARVVVAHLRRYRDTIDVASAAWQGLWLPYGGTTGGQLAPAGYQPALLARTSAQYPRII